MSWYALTIFLSAFLLFQVQPLMAKFILPWFGGGAGVWTVCMLFFQCVLLAGYAYAHLLSSSLSVSRQGLVHIVVLGLSIVFLPITPEASWKPSGAESPTLDILLLLLVNVGVPFAVLSATGPLLSRWFSLSHPQHSPYRLYALSVDVLPVFGTWMPNKGGGVHPIAFGGKVDVKTKQNCALH